MLTSSTPVARVIRTMVRISWWVLFLIILLLRNRPLPLIFEFLGGPLKPACLKELFPPPLLEELCLPRPLPLPLFEHKLSFASRIAEDPAGLELWFFFFFSTLFNFVQRLGDNRQGLNIWRNITLDTPALDTPAERVHSRHEK